MHMKLSVPRIIIWCVTIAAAVVFTLTLARALFYSPESEIEVPFAAGGSASRQLRADDSPKRLIIPSIGVDADVQHVGIARSGNMAVPTNYSDVGWFRHGTIPGEVGSAVVDGHVDNGLSLPGVFKRLGDVEAGDDVYVEREDGSRLHFVVESVRSYPYDAVPRELLFDRADAARLNLISCEGSWLPGEKTYDQRVVVFARLALD